MCIRDRVSGTFNGVAPGAHSVVARDANLCLSAAVPVSVGQPTAVVASPVATGASCFGGTGSITVTASGGTGAYEFQLDSGSFQVSGTFSLSLIHISGPTRQAEI